MKKIILSLIIGAAVGTAITLFATKPKWDYDECHRYHESYIYKFSDAMANTPDELFRILKEFEDNLPEGCREYLDLNPKGTENFVPQDDND